MGSTIGFLDHKGKKSTCIYSKEFLS